MKTEVISTPLEGEIGTATIAGNGNVTKDVTSFGIGRESVPDPNLVGQVKCPTVGRMLWVIPSLEEQATRTGKGVNGADHIPAVVTQVFPNSWLAPSQCEDKSFSGGYTGVNMVATAVDGTTHPLYSLQHASTAQNGNACWVWPKIN